MIVAWQFTARDVRNKRSVPEGRCDFRARINCHPRLQSIRRSMAPIVGKTTDPDHTAPYGADPFIAHSWQ